MKVLFFASARTATGQAEAELSVPEPVSLDEVWRRLVAQYPGLASLRGSARLSCNERYADEGTLFHDSDEAGVIPPVSGG